MTKNYTYYLAMILMSMTAIFTIINTKRAIFLPYKTMNEQIIKIETDPKDHDCLQITLRQKPLRIQFWRKQEAKLTTYKGYGRHWYCLPSFRPAPTKLIPLLKQISQGPQFKHLRFKLKSC